MGPPNGVHQAAAPAGASCDCELALHTLKKNILATQYAVRGDIVRRAQVRRARSHVAGPMDHP